MEDFDETVKLILNQEMDIYDYNISIIPIF